MKNLDNIRDQQMQKNIKNKKKIKKKMNKWNKIMINIIVYLTLL